MFRTILVPLDGSPFAEQALPWALSIARRAGGRLDLVRGHSLYALKEPAASWGPYDSAAEAESWQEDQLYLDGTAKWLSSMSPVSTTTAVVRAVPSLDAEGILQRVHAARPDLIVMATHGRGMLGRFLLGSTADELIRRSAVSVLIIRPREPAPGLLPEPIAQNVLIGLDGSPLAEEALEPAVDLARLLEAECTLLRVVDPSEATEARAYLEGIAERLCAEGLAVEERVVVARHADEVILEEARKLPNAVIALATHGRGGVRRMLLGSIADKVIHRASCPVLVYHPATR